MLEIFKESIFRFSNFSIFESLGVGLYILRIKICQNGKPKNSEKFGFLFQAFTFEKKTLTLIFPSLPVVPAEKMYHERQCIGTIEIRKRWKFDVTRSSLNIYFHSNSGFSVDIFLSLTEIWHAQIIGVLQIFLPVSKIGFIYLCIFPI